MHRGAVAEIDLDAIAHNLDVVKAVTKNRPVIAVVKADAYGHGAVEVSKKLIGSGVYCLAVAFNSEAVQLRDAGIRSKVLVLFERQDIKEIFDYRLTPVLHDIETARRINREAKKRNQRINVHLKIDTGMGRLGFNSRHAMEDITAVSEMDNLSVEGIMSHFSDADISDKSRAQEQIEKFNAIRKTLTKTRKNKFLFHIANSAATISLKDAHMDAVRPGIMLYGCSPTTKDAGFRIQDGRYKKHPHGIKGGSSCIVHHASSLRPAMTVKTNILALRRMERGAAISYGGTFITKRESIVAVIPVGYADGYSRTLSNSAEILVRGRRAPVVGRVCMDLFMADVTDIKGVKHGDEAVILGRQGREEITADELASGAGTISYEILTSLGKRSRRVYKS